VHKNYIYDIIWNSFIVGIFALFHVIYIMKFNKLIIWLELGNRGAGIRSNFNIYIWPVFRTLC